MRPHILRFSWMMISTWGSVSELDSRATGKRTVDSTHDESDLGGVCRTGEMGVDLFRLCLVERDESVQNVVTGGGIVGAP